MSSAYSDCIAAAATKEVKGKGSPLKELDFLLPDSFWKMKKKQKKNHILFEILICHTEKN